MRNESYVEGEIRFARILRGLMDERGYTIEDVSGATGISRATIGHWTRGTMPGDLLKVRRLARFFGVPFEYMVFGDTATHEAARLDMIPRKKILEGYFKLTLEQLVSSHSTEPKAGSLLDKA